jgi:hypothetical protein
MLETDMFSFMRVGLLFFYPTRSHGRVFAVVIRRLADFCWRSGELDFDTYLGLARRYTSFRASMGSRLCRPEQLVLVRAAVSIHCPRLDRLPLRRVCVHIPPLSRYFELIIFQPNIVKFQMHGHTCC